MAGTTPNMALPYPDPTDPVQQGAAKIKALAQALDTANGAFTAYVPALTGVTLGNGTKSGFYQKVGRTVRGYAQVTLGSTSAVTGTPTFGLPVNAKSAASWTSVEVQLLDAGTTTYRVIGIFAAATVAAYTPGGSGALVNITNVAPFTWAVNDQIEVHFEYESAA